MYQKPAINLVMVVFLVTFLVGCASEEAVAPEESQSESAWVQEGNTYTVDVSYDNPNGTSEDTFSITLDDAGVVTAAEAIVPEDGGKHAEGLVKFNEALSPAIVGKNLSELGDFDTLGQYSLTTDAFNEALKDLQAQVNTTS